MELDWEKEFLLSFGSNTSHPFPPSNAPFQGLLISFGADLDPSFSAFLQVCRYPFPLKRGTAWRTKGRKGHRLLFLCLPQQRSPCACLSSLSPGSQELIDPQGFLRSHTIALLSRAINFRKADPGSLQLPPEEAPSALIASNRRGSFITTQCWDTI